MSETQPKKNKFINLLKKFLPLIGIIIFIYLIIDIGPDIIISTLIGISPYVLILIITLMFLTFLISNFVWQLIFKKQKISISYLKSLKLLFIGVFYAIITPSRVGGYSKILYLKEETNEPTGKLFVNVFVYNLIQAIPFYLILVIAAFLIVEQFPDLFFWILVYVSVIGFLMLLFIKKERGEKTIYLFIKYLIPKRLKGYLNEFSQTFYKDFPRIRDFILPFIICIFIQIINFTLLYILALELGIETPFHIFIVLYSIASLISAIPVTIGGLGIKEAALLGLFAPFNIAAEKIVALSLTAYILSALLFALPGFFLSLQYTRSNKKLSKLKDIDNIPKN